MISAIHELAEKETYIGDHKRVAEYLEACHKLFEEGILSHTTVSSTDQQLLVNMDKGFQFFSAMEGKHSGVMMVRPPCCRWCMAEGISSLSSSFDFRDSKN